MATFKIEYANGITQEKVLISHQDWLRIKEMPENSKEEQQIKEIALFKLTGGKEWFTDESPYYEAIKTGILNCNGNHKVFISSLDTH